MAYQEEINRRLKTIARQQREMQKCMDGGDSSSTDAILTSILDVLGTIFEESDFEIKALPPICYTDDTGQIFQLVICQKFEDNILVSTEEIWLGPTGIIATAPDGLLPCTEDALCAPQTESFLGDAATLIGFDSYQVLVPKCCAVVITTSAGTITLPAQPNPYSFSQEFKCLLSSYSISGDCVDTVTTILTKSK